MKNVKPHILIVEDEPDINELLCISLKKNDYIVSKCFDGERLQEILNPTSFY